MPIKEENMFLCEAHKTVQATLAKDIDYLVDRIGETLRLKAKQKQKQQRAFRTSPYSVPYRISGSRSREHGSACSCTSPECHKKCMKKKPFSSDDPHELLQELLKAGNLVSEAVNRLHNRQRKKSFHYESDEDLDF